MIIDSYCMTEDSLPFVDDDKKVYRLIYPVKKSNSQRLCMWVQYDRIGTVRRGYYLYISVENMEQCGISYLIDGSACHGKVLLMEAERNTRGAYYEAGVMAGCYAKQIIEEFCKGIEVDWNSGTAHDTGMSENMMRIHSCSYDEFFYRF